ncbi:hypothetical protein ABFA07_006519 [Porites harrisoni]
MNISNFNQSVETSSSPQTTSQPPPGLTTFTQVTYSVLASIALVGNTLVIVVFIQDRKLLRKSYNILILSLAVADVLTAISLITNPAFVLGDAFPYPTNPILGDIFCRVIWSRTFLFQLVVFSGYICLALVTERWYAVMRPLKYSETFNKKRTLIYIFMVWLWSLVLCCSTFFRSTIRFVFTIYTMQMGDGLETTTCVGWNHSSLLQNGASQLYDACSVHSHDVQGWPIHCCLSRKQDKTARENDTNDWCRLLVADYLFCAKSDQLCVSIGGNNAA